MTDRITFTAPATVTAEGRRIRGSVQLAGSRTWRNGEWLEVDPGALAAADASDVVARWDHDPSKILGRTTNGTVSLNRDDQGLSYETAELPNTTYANDALELVNGGYVTGSSFEIEGLGYSFSKDPVDGARVRRITSIARVTDVSPTPHPAFVDSMAAAFTKETGMSAPTPEVEPVEPAQPEAAPATKPEAPHATFSANETAEATERFARTLSTEQIEQAMDGIVAEANGDLRGIALDQYEAYAKVYGERKRVDAEVQERAARMQALHNIRLGRIPKAPAQTGLLESDDYREAFNRFLRGDRVALEQFAGQSVTGDGTQGGYSVPESFRQRIVERMKAFGGIQQVAETITTSDGRDLPWPTNDDTANSAVIATEGSAAGSGGADLVFGEVRLGAYTYDATGASNNPLLVSKELIQDSAFDIEAFVSRKLAERLGRKMAADFATADGSSKPKGLLAKSADVMSATTMYAALVEHHFQVDQAYRESGNCRWVLGDSTLANIYGSVDLNGRPLFIPTADASGAGRPAGTLLGYPVQLDQGAGTKVAFGDIFQGFIIRYVRDVQVDVDPYTNIKSRQIAYHAWARADSDVQDANAYSVSDYSTVSADATS